MSFIVHTSYQRFSKRQASSSTFFQLSSLFISSLTIYLLVDKGIFMTNTEILNEYFIWEEKNLIEPQMKSENNGVNDHNVIMKNTEIMNELENWRTITDPKLRKKMRKRAESKRYREKNKDKIRLRKKAWLETNKEYHKNYYNNNKNEFKLKSKKYYELNKDVLQLQHKEYYQKNKEHIKSKTKDYFKLNKNKIYKHRNNRSKNDIQYKLSNNLRKRLIRALRNNQKSGSAVKDLGCTIEEFKTYLENKFLTGMTWDNWTKDGWHIDHIKPLSSFDLSDRVQILEACHYTNLQPLWAKDNLTKSDKIILGACHVG